METYMRIKELRQQRDWTQNILAQAMGTSQQNVARWERGEATMSPDRLIEMANLFGVTVDELLGHEKPKSDASRQFSQITNGTPWGTLRLTLKDRCLEYPIDHEVRDEIVDWLRFPDFHDEFLLVAAMNNKVVLIDAHLVDRLELIDDNLEAMPSFLTPDAYKALAEGRQPPGSDSDKKQAQALLEELGGIEGQAYEAYFHKVRILRRDLSEQTEYASPSLLGALTSSEIIEKQETLLVMDDFDTGDWKCVPMRDAAIVEIPRERLSEVHDGQ